MIQGSSYYRPTGGNENFIEMPINIVWKTKFTAEAQFESQEHLQEWLRSIRNPQRQPYYTPPFNELVFDRDDDEPHCMTMRVALGFENKGITITDFLDKLGWPCAGVPKPYSSETILEDLSKKYEIDGETYQILGLISDSGCYGDVYKAINIKTEEIVAIKVLRIEGDNEAAEMQKMARAGGHSNIVEYIGYRKVMDKGWIVMEYIPGRHKWEVERDREWTSEMERQYQAGLIFMRRAGVQSWRENDRQNVLVTPDGTVKLIDFGTLARN